MTRQFLQKCIELREQYRNEVLKSLDGETNEELERKKDFIWARYYNLVCSEIKVYHFDVIDSLINYARDKGLTIENIINALRAMDIEVTE